MTPTDEFPKLLDLAMAEVQQNTRELVDRNSLAAFRQWAFDERTGRLSFQNPGVDEFVVPAQLLGFWNPADSRWQWAWSDSTLPPHAVRASAAARDWGAAHAVTLLTASTSSAEEPLAWKLAAFAARLTGWPAVYRGSSGARFQYLAFAGPPP
jgi:hypothetical protein